MSDRDTQEQLEILLGIVAVETLSMEWAEEQIKPIKEAVKVMLNQAKALVMYDNTKQRLARFKADVVTFARENLNPKRTLVPETGYVDVTPQPPIAIVDDLKALLADPLAHTFIESVTLTESASEHLRTDHTISGVKLEDVPARVKMSVEKYKQILEEGILGGNNG